MNVQYSLSRSIFKDPIPRWARAWPIFRFISPLHQVHSAHSRSSPLLANPALPLLENWTATTRTSLPPTAVVVSVMLTWLVLLIRQLDLESGSQCTHLFALQKDVASRVSGGNKFVLKLLYHRYCHFAKPPWQLSKQCGENRNNTSREWEDNDACVHPLWCLWL